MPAPLAPSHDLRYKSRPRFRSLPAADRFTTTAARRRHSLEASEVPHHRHRADSEDTDMSGGSAGSGSSPGKPMSRAGPSKRKAQPLRRGDACLMCRAKKLKCSATKPVCDQCHKRKDRCVYDAIRPASRVEKLERKLAEIEEAELKAALATRRHSEVSTPQPYKPFTGESNSSRPPLSASLDSGMYGGYPQQSYAPSLTFPERPTTASSTLGTPTLGPGPIDIWPFTDPFAIQPPIPPTANTSAVQIDSLPWPLLSASNDVSTLWGSTSYMDGMTDSLSMDGMAANLDTFNTDPAQLAFPPPTFMANGVNANPLPDSVNDMANHSPANGVIDDVLAHATTFSGVQLLESDISQSARDYLLDLFFCPPRSKAGSEPWSETQFRLRMKMGNWQRPHPALLFAMYTVAASSSYIPAVRALADSLYAIAAKKVDESISQEDRLLDCINAIKMLGKWLFSKARALEAYNMTWKAVSLVHACQLDKITTNKWTPEMAKGGRTQENPWPLLGPPKDQWDLCERIHAFWGVWGNVRGASIMLPWQTPINDDTILTPLPYTPELYLDGTIRSLPDINLRDIYEMPHSGSKPMNFSYAILLASVHLLHRAKTLQSDRPESHTTYRSLANRKPGLTRCLRQENPAAYTEIMDAAKYIHANLPPDARLDLLSSSPWTNPDVPMILVCLIGVRLHLHEPEGDEYDRDACLSAAKEAASIVKLWIRQLKIDELKDARHSNAKSSSRNKNGVAGPYVLVPWFWTANRLIRSAKVLRKLGRDVEAVDLETDASLVIQGLKEQGVLYPIAAESTDLFDKGM